jgi:GNAT superfamily N-acetyltransferase
MKIAELEDVDTILAMAMQFVRATGYEKLSDEETIKNLITQYVTSSSTDCIIIFDEFGFIAGRCTDFPFGPGKIASETAWWIDPDSRGQNRGQKLMQAFEYWAKVIAEANMISMTSLDKDVEKIYKKNGYKLYERAYMKVF